MSAPSPPPRHTHSRRQVAVTLMSLVLLGGVGAVSVRVRQDARQVRHLTVLPGHDQCASALAFNPNGQQLFTGDWGGNIRVWQLPQGKLTRTLPPADGPINALAVAPNGAQLAVGDDSGQVRRWEIGSGRLLPTLDIGLPVRRLAFSPDSQEIAVVAHDASAVYRFNTRTGDALPIIATPRSVTTLAYAPDGKTLAIADARSVQLWDRSARRVRQTLPQTEVASLTFSPDSRMLVTNGVYRDVTVYRTADGSMVRRIHLDQPGNSTFAPGSQRFLVGHGGDLTLYDVQSGQATPSLRPATLLASTPPFLMRVFPSLRDYQRLPVETLAISPDGKLAAFSIQEDVTLMPLSPPQTMSVR